MPSPPLCAVAHTVHCLQFYANGVLCLAYFTAGGDVGEAPTRGPFLQSGRRRGHRPHVPPQAGQLQPVLARARHLVLEGGASFFAAGGVSFLNNMI